MNSNSGYDYAMIVIPLLMAASAWIGFCWGHHSGMIDLAAGQFQCELVEADDKTTDWECSQDPEWKGGQP